MEGFCVLFCVESSGELLLGKGFFCSCWGLKVYKGVYILSFMRAPIIWRTLRHNPSYSVTLCRVHQTPPRFGVVCAGIIPNQDVHYFQKVR